MEKRLIINIIASTLLIPYYFLYFNKTLDLVVLFILIIYTSISILYLSLEEDDFFKSTILIIFIYSNLLIFIDNSWIKFTIPFFGAICLMLFLTIYCSNISLLGTIYLGIALIVFLTLKIISKLTGFEFPIKFIYYLISLFASLIILLLPLLIKYINRRNSKALKYDLHFLPLIISSDYKKVLAAFYLIILIYAQFKKAGISLHVSDQLEQFLEANEYSIVTFLALDFLISSIRQSKKLKEKWIDELIKKDKVQ